MSPNPTLLPFPCGSAPFETRRGGHLCGSRCQRTLSAHRRVSTPYPLSSVVSGAVLPPGHKSWSRCPLSALLRQPRALRLLWGSSCRVAVQEPSKVEKLAVFRVHRGRGGAHWFCHPHLTDTTVRPLAPHPRHRTRPVRSSTLARGLKPSRAEIPASATQRDGRRRNRP
jgi:hypothetical protein